MLVVDDRYKGDDFYNDRQLMDIVVAHDPTESNRVVGYVRIAEQTDSSLWLRVGNTSNSGENYLAEFPAAGSGLRINTEELGDLITVLQFFKIRLEEKRKNRILGRT